MAKWVNGYNLERCSQATIFLGKVFHCEKDEGHKGKHSFWTKNDNRTYLVEVRWEVND